MLVVSFLKEYFLKELEIDQMKLNEGALAYKVNHHFGATVSRVLETFCSEIEMQTSLTRAHQFFCCYRFYR